MGRRGYGWLAGLVGVLMVSLGGARAQGPAEPSQEQSYVEIHPSGETGNVADILQERLKRLEGMSDVQQLLQKLLRDPRRGDMAQQLEQLGVSRAADPAMGPTVWPRGIRARHRPPDEEQAGANPPESGSAATSEPVEGTTTAHRANAQRPGHKTAGYAAGRSTGVQPPASAQQPGQETPLGGPKAASGVPPKAPPLATGPEAGSASPGTGQVAGEGDSMSTSVASWLLEQSKQLQRMPGGLHNSIALQHAIEHLDRYLSGQSTWAKARLPNGFADRLAKVIQHAQSKRLWPGRGLPHLPHLSLPSLHRPSLPGVHAPHVHVPSWHAPQVRVAAPGAGSGKAVLWVAVIGVGVWFLWRLSRMTRPGEWFARNDSAAWDHGR